MRCKIHDIEMYYDGEYPFGGDIWICERCIDDEEYEYHRCLYCGDHVDFCDCGFIPADDDTEYLQ